MSVSRDEVAKKAGVSTATVSRVFNKPHTVVEETRSKVLRAAKRLGYRPNKQASMLRRRDNGQLLVIDDQLSRAKRGAWRAYSWMWASIEKALLSSISASPLDMRRTSVTGPKSFQTVVNSEHWAGIVIINTTRSNYIQIAKNSGLPYIIISAYGAHPVKNLVMPDEIHGSSLLAHHLISLGRQSTLYVSPSIQRLPQRQQRYEGFHQVLPISQCLEMQTDERCNRELEKKLPLMLKENHFDAIYAESSNLAARILNCLNTNGIKPVTDIGLISYDNAHWLSHLSIRLTSVDNRIEAIVQNAIERILYDISRNQQNQHPCMTIKPKLVEGESIQTSP